jgi:hypothetical protein
VKGVVFLGRPTSRHGRGLWMLFHPCAQYGGGHCRTMPWDPLVYARPLLSLSKTMRVAHHTEPCR